MLPFVSSVLHVMIKSFVVFCVLWCMLCYGSITPNDSAFIAFGLLGFRKKQQLSSNLKFLIKWLLLHESQSM